MRPIDAEHLTNDIALYMAENAYLNDTPLELLKKVVQWINDTPTIDPESLRPQGEWSVGYYNYEGVYVRDCSYCGYAHDDLSPHCPSCGAKMKEADNHA